MVSVGTQSTQLLCDGAKKFSIGLSSSSSTLVVKPRIKVALRSFGLMSLISW